MSVFSRDNGIACLLALIYSNFASTTCNRDSLLRTRA